MTGFLLHPPLLSGPDQTEPLPTTVGQHSASSNVLRALKASCLVVFSSCFILWTYLMYLQLEDLDITCMSHHLTIGGYEGVTVNCVSGSWGWRVRCGNSKP